MNQLKNFLHKSQIFIFLLCVVSILSRCKAQEGYHQRDSLLNIIKNNSAVPLQREKAIQQFQKYFPGDTTIVSACLAILSEKNNYLAGEAASALRRYGAASLSGIVPLLESSVEQTRWQALIALYKMKTNAVSALPYITKLIEDKSWRIRWCAILTLGNFGSAASSALPKIIPYLKERDRELAWAAVKAIEQIDSTILHKRPDDNSIQAALEQRIPSLMKYYHVPGVSVALIKDGKIAYSKQFGIADVRSGRKVTPETMFEGCSMTKPAFAVLVMKLVEEKKLDLDTPLASYLNEEFVNIIHQPNTITARMVLTHSSGLPNWRNGSEETDGPISMYFSPGLKFQYSGEGFFYLQRVVEKITGEPLASYAKRVMIDPLGLKYFS
ncbi:MAG: serine hydrolase, partial [Bacteroidetes bacterium]|nr:serine hydrolase [Bacteroidota bacterium]